MKIITVDTDSLIETARTMEEKEAVFLAAVCLPGDNCCRLYYLIDQDHTR